MTDQFAGPSTLETLDAAFGGNWGIWLSQTGRWWAARRAALTSAQLIAGCVPFLRADTPAELAERLRDQEGITGQAGRYLA
jgi:hypothetical protein